MAAFLVEKPGILSTVQDAGRHGYQEFGVPVAGAADEFAFQLANLLVGNQPDEAALELTMAGPVLKILEDGVIAVTGADMDPRLNGRPLPMWEAVRVAPGDVLAFGWARCGCRAYLAVAGGIDVPPVMGSRSTYLRGAVGGLEGRALGEGDVLRGGTPRIPLEELAGRRIPPEHVPEEYRVPRPEATWAVRVVLGPQDDHFTARGIATFLGSAYQVTAECDRMGYRLEGPPIEHVKGPDIISDGIPLGAVQVPGHGQPIIMLQDRQTTGGYAKIATVITSDLWKVAQARPGEFIRFAAVSLAEAHRAYARYREKIRLLAHMLCPRGSRGAHYRVAVGGKSFSAYVLPE